MDIESTAHFLLHCPTYIIERRTLLSNLVNIDNNLLDLCEPVLIRTLLFGINSFDTDANANVVNVTIEYIFSTKRFDEPLFQWKQKIFKQCYESVHSLFIVFTCIICKFLFYFLRICFIPGYPYSPRYPVIVSFNFTVYDIIYIYIYIYIYITLLFMIFGNNEFFFQESIEMELKISFKIFKGVFEWEK